MDILNIIVFSSLIAFTTFYFGAGFSGVLASYIILCIVPKIASLVVLGLFQKLSAPTVVATTLSLRLVAFIVQSTLLFQLIVMQNFTFLFTPPPYDGADFSIFPVAIYIFIIALISLLTLVDEIAFYSAVKTLANEKINLS